MRVTDIFKSKEKFITQNMQICCVVELQRDVDRPVRDYFSKVIIDHILYKCVDGYGPAHALPFKRGEMVSLIVERA